MDQDCKHDCGKEVDELRRELEQATKQAELDSEHIGGLQQDGQQLEAEVAQLERELEKIVGYFNIEESLNADLCQELDAAKKIAENSLIAYGKQDDLIRRAAELLCSEFAGSLNWTKDAKQWLRNAGMGKRASIERIARANEDIYDEFIEPDAGREKK